MFLKINIVVATVVGLSSVVSFAQSTPVNPPVAYVGQLNGEIMVIKEQDENYMYAAASTVESSISGARRGFKKSAASTYTMLSIDPTPTFITKTMGRDVGTTIVTTVQSLKNRSGVAVGYYDPLTNQILPNRVEAPIKAVDGSHIMGLIAKIHSDSPIYIYKSSLEAIAKTTDKSGVTNLVKTITAHDPVSAQNLADTINTLTHSDADVPHLQAMRDAYTSTKAAVASKAVRAASKALNEGTEIKVEAAVGRAVE